MNKKYLALIIIVPSLASVGLLLSPNIFDNTGNPSECWYQEDDGILKPCVVDEDMPLFPTESLNCSGPFPDAPHKDAIWNGDKCWWYLVDQKIPFELLTFEHGFSWNGDPLGNIEEWCDDNNGLWFPKNTSCKYLTDEAGRKATADLDDKENPPVGGKKALAICQTVDIPCPDDPEFDGHYNLQSGRTFIHQYKFDEHYTFYFDEIDKELFYRICVIDTDECTQYKKIRVHNDDNSSVEVTLLDYSIEITALDVEINSSTRLSGLGEIQVIDLDMDKNKEAVDSFDVHVWSDADSMGIDLRVTETNESTGIFEGTLYLSNNDESSGARLLIAQGDTIYAQYKEKTTQSEITFPLNLIL
jgi:hypothetical protein